MEFRQRFDLLTLFSDKKLKPVYNISRTILLRTVLLFNYIFSNPYNYIKDESQLRCENLTVATKDLSFSQLQSFYTIQNDVSNLLLPLEILLLPLINSGVTWIYNNIRRSPCHLRIPTPPSPTRSATSSSSSLATTTIAVAAP